MSEINELEQFENFKRQVIHSLNLVPLDRDQKENEFIKYNWLKQSEEPAREL